MMMTMEGEFTKIVNLITSSEAGVLVLKQGQISHKVKMQFSFLLCFLCFLLPLLLFCLFIDGLVHMQI